jgi:hypothetical protein
VVGEVKGYLWMQRRLADVTREEAAAAVGGAMRKWKWYVLCLHCTLLGEAGKIWLVGRKSVGNSLEVATYRKRRGKSTIGA